MFGSPSRFALACLVLGSLTSNACSDTSGDDAADGAGTSGAATGSSGEPDPMNAQPTFEARVDAAAACGAGAASLQLRATRIGCVDPPPAPCTLPNPPRTDVGEEVACPSSATDAVLRVEVTMTGRFYVELVTIASDGTETGECHAEGDDPEMIVTEAILAGKPTIEVTALGGPCPEP